MDIIKTYSTHSRTNLSCIQHNIFCDLFHTLFSFSLSFFLTETVLPVVDVLQTYQKSLSLTVQHLFWEFKRMAKIIPEGKLHGDLLLENKER